jgi:hypothetical protein
LFFCKTGACGIKMVFSMYLEPTEMLENNK